MKLVLLPGMDGTGLLFEKFITQIPDVETAVISFPTDDKDQSYEALLKFTKRQLPNDDYILLAESFSGPIGAQLAFEKPRNLKAVIFVATFLTPPNPSLLKVAQRLPLKQLVKLPAASLLLKYLMFGKSTQKKQLTEFESILNKLPAAFLRARLQSIAQLKGNEKSSNLPALYLRATLDKLVPQTKGEEFRASFSDLEVADINGPHFFVTKPTSTVRICYKGIYKQNTIGLIMTKADQKPDVFKALQPLLAKHAKKMSVVKDTTDNYYLNTEKLGKNKKPSFFGAVQIKKNYVSFHLMPVYSNPALLDAISDELKSKMQGKSCFNFSEVDKKLFAELKSLTKTSFDDYVESGLV